MQAGIFQSVAGLNRTKRAVSLSKGKKYLADCLQTSSAPSALLGLHLLAFKLELHHQLSWVLSLPAHTGAPEPISYNKSLLIVVCLTHTHTTSLFLWRTLANTDFVTEERDLKHDLWICSGVSRIGFLIQLDVKTLMTLFPGAERYCLWHRRQ